MSLIFKTIAEVKLMHEYFLINDEGKSPFGLNNQTDRMAFLDSEFVSGREGLSQFIRFEFPEALRPLYSSYGLHISPSYFGFKISQKVQSISLSSGDLVYKPLNPLPDDMDILVSILRSNGRFNDYSDARLSKPLDTKFYFSNEDGSRPRIFPYLTNPVNDFDSGREYEQGELALFGGAIVNRFYVDGGGQQWDPAEGFTFASEADSLLIPLKLKYRTNSSLALTQLNFVLQDASSQEVWQNSFSGVKAIEKSTLDFTQIENKLIPGGAGISSLHTLIVNGSNGFSREHTVIFSNTGFDDSLWGMTVIRANVTNPAFDLLDLNGYLKKRRLADGTQVEAPIFEIPIKSRFTYWRYLNNKGRSLKFLPAHTDYLFLNGESLMTVKPHAMTQAWFQLLKPDNTQPKYFPNPVNYEIKRDGIGRLYVDVSVPDSDLFPIIP